VSALKWVGGLLLAWVVLEMLKNLVLVETATRLERIPYAILRLARRRLPVEHRKTIHDQEWLPELVVIVRETEGLPITRLVRGVLYSIGLLFVASRVSKIRAVAPLAPKSRRRRKRIKMIEALTYAGLLAGAVVALPWPLFEAAALAALGASAAMWAARSGLTLNGRMARFAVAGGCNLLAIWIVLVGMNVEIIEAYTLPFAVLALAAGLYEDRKRPYLGSWLAFGPGLVAGISPSLAVALVDQNPPVARPTLLISIALVVIALGMLRQQRALVVLGSAQLVIAVSSALLAAELGWLLAVMVVATSLLSGIAWRLGVLDHNLQRVRTSLARMR
jgi:hypothetical protein